MPRRLRGWCPQKTASAWKRGAGKRSPTACSTREYSRGWKTSAKRSCGARRGSTARWARSAPGSLRWIPNSVTSPGASATATASPTSLSASAWAGSISAIPRWTGRRVRPISRGRLRSSRSGSRLPIRFRRNEFLEEETHHADTPASFALRIPGSRRAVRALPAFRLADFPRSFRRVVHSARMPEALRLVGREYCRRGEGDGVGGNRARHVLGVLHRNPRTGGRVPRRHRLPDPARGGALLRLHVRRRISFQLEARLFLDVPRHGDALASSGLVAGHPDPRRR